MGWFNSFASTFGRGPRRGAEPVAPVTALNQTKTAMNTPAKPKKRPAVAQVGPARLY
jgi:hypothetical protein